MSQLLHLLLLSLDILTLDLRWYDYLSMIILAAATLIRTVTTARIIPIILTLVFVFVSINSLPLSSRYSYLSTISGLRFTAIAG